METGLKIYKNTLSFLLMTLFGKGCIYTPTCSEYAKLAVDKYGIIKGSMLSIKRLSRCHPWAEGGYDHP